MQNLRQSYYNAFSSFYDKFVALHSVDRHGDIRSFLAEAAHLKEGDSVLDICTGTGSLLLRLRQKIGEEGLIAGVDFSRGMLNVCSKKTNKHRNIFLIESDAANLPFKGQTFDAVTCSHAFYELKGNVRDRTLKEVARVVKKGKPFLMMEHDVPENVFIRTLFYIRLFSMGAKEALSILKHEKEILKRCFRHVKKIKTPTGRSKVLICWN